MYDVLDISRYIINYCHSKKYYIHNLKLQKLLYFVQAYFLMKVGTPCFYQDIEAWVCGPIVPESYNEFKCFAECLIPEAKTYFVYPNGTRDFIDRFKAEKVDFDDEIILKEDKVLINLVVDELADFSMTFLNEKAMNQLPYNQAYDNCPYSIIDKRTIKEYFQNN